MAKDKEAPMYPAPPMSEEDHHESARHAAEEAKKAAPKAKDEPPKTPNDAGHFAAPKKD